MIESGAQNYALFKRTLRGALELVTEELSHSSQDPDRYEALRVVQRELAELNADRRRPPSASGRPGPRQLRSHNLVKAWAADDPVRVAVLEVEHMHLKRLP